MAWIKEHWYIIVFVIGVLASVFFVRNNRRRTQRIRELHTELGESYGRLAERESVTKEHITRMQGNIDDSLRRFEEIERDVECGAGAAERIREEVSGALSIIRAVRERGKDPGGTDPSDRDPGR